MIRGRFSGIALVAALGCTASGPAPKSEDEGDVAAPDASRPAVYPNAFRPLWYLGDRWILRIEDGPDVPKLDMPGLATRFEWEFHVEVVADGKVRIEAVELGESRPRFIDKRTLVFDTAGRLLEVGWPNDVLEPVRQLPRVNPGSLMHMGMEIWPLFPLADIGQPGDAVVQRVSKRGKAYEVEVTLTGRNSGWAGRTTLTQRWEIGRPWWSSAELRVVQQEDADTDGVLVWSGEVTQWGGKAADP